MVKTPVCAMEALPNHCQLIMVAERKGVDRLDIQEPARADASPSRSTAKGDEKVSHKTYTQEEYKYLIRYTLGLSKPTDNVGQHAKNNGEGKLSQFRWLGIRLELKLL